MEASTFSESTKTFPRTETNWSPPVVLDRIEARRGPVFVAREDLLPGGTKQRAIIPYLETLIREGVREVVYASPFCGFAQVALAVSARALKIPVTLFCERDPASQGKPKAHEFSELARSFGARIYLCDSLGEAEMRASDFVQSSRLLFKIPLGFRDPRYMNCMRRKLVEEYGHCKQILDGEPRRIWLPVGSGTLAGIFAQILKPTVRILCVDVGVLPPEDPRLQNLSRIPNVRLFRAPELFRERSRTLPPVPSNAHYDAKLWRWIQENGEAGDLWWNVAR